MRIHREPRSPEPTSPASTSGASTPVGSSRSLAPEIPTARDSMAGLLVRLQSLESMFGLTWADDLPGYTSAHVGPGPGPAHHPVYLVRELPARASPPIWTPPAVVAPQPVQAPQPVPSTNWAADSAPPSSVSEWTDPIPDIESLPGVPCLIPSTVRTSDRRARRLRKEERDLLAQEDVRDTTQENARDTTQEDARNSTQKGAPGSSSSAAILESLVHPHNCHPPPPPFFFHLIISRGNSVGSGGNSANLSAATDGPSRAYNRSKLMRTNRWK